VQPGTHEPNADAVTKIAAYAAQQGVLVLTAGTYGNVLRFLPPLSISDDLLHEGLDVLADVLADL